MTTKGALVPDGRGGFSSTAPAAPAAKTQTQKAAIELPPGAKEMMTPVLEKALEGLQGVIDMVGSSKVAEMPEDGSMPGVPEEVWSSLVGVVQMIGKLEGMYPKAPPADDSAEESAAEDAAEGGTEEPGEMQMRNTLKAMVTKVGAKMSKERLGRFATALDTLASILGELQTGNAPAAGVPAPAPAGKGAPPKAPAKKAEMPLAPDPALVSLTATVAKLAEAVAKQGTTVTSIQKARGSGNAIPVEDGGGSGESEVVSWPLDMNRSVEPRGKTNFFG